MLNTPLTATSENQPPAEKKPNKKIVVCCDGTGNDFRAPNVDKKDKGSGQNSNVVKFYTALKVDNDQVAYYHPGVGTMGAPTATHWITRQWSRIKGLAFGLGFADCVLDAYRYIMENYNDNDGNPDEVYIIGFSRGSYVARALAGLLHGYGLLCRGNEGHLGYAWRMYVEQHDKRGRVEVEPNKAFKQTFTHPGFKIKFLGVWDTVSSVGWITTPLRLFNMAKNDTVEIARHAVSIDERRCFYVDNLWDDKQTVTDLVQVWFPGVHSDLGSSYPQTQAGLANQALKWMLAEAKAAGVVFDDAKRGLVQGIEPEAMPPHCSELLYIAPPEDYEIHNSLRRAWWLLEILPHIYYDKDLGKYITEEREKKLTLGHAVPEEQPEAELRRIPLGAHRQLPDGALLHRSVITRMANKQLGYAPPNVLCGQWSLSDLVAKDGSQYYEFSAPKRKTPGPLSRVLHGKVIMWIIGATELGVYAFILGTIAFAILHFAFALVVCLGHHAPHWVHCLFAWILKYPKAWGWCHCD